MDIHLIIIYNKTIHLDGIEYDDKIFYIKSLIKEKSNIDIDNQILTYCGKVLDNDQTIEDYGIKNNDILFLSNKIKGGNVPGFPDVGKTIILLTISTLMLLVSYLFFSNIIDAIYKLPSEISCDPFPDISGEKSSINIKELLSKQKLDKQKGGQTLEKNHTQNIMYEMSSMFYVSMIVIIITIYSYTIFCNHGLSSWLIVAAVASFIIVFFIFYIVYQLVKRKIIETTEVTYYSTIGFAVLGAILLILTFIIPAWSNTSFMHWTTYLYPIGVIAMTALVYYIKNSTDWSNYIKLLAYIGGSIVLLFIPYILAYVFNVEKLCI